MYPNQQQPTQPGVPAPPATNFDFTAPNQPSPPAAAPIAPAPDPNFTALQNDIAEIKAALGTQQAPPAPIEPEPQQQPAKKYDEWGAVFEDTAKQTEEIINKRLAEQRQADETARQATTQQEQQNQQYIDNTVTQLRNAGYLPPVANQFDTNDQGKQAENELLGYAISLGSTDLVNAAKELKFRHDAGFKYDYQNKQFVQVNQPNTQDPNAAMFGNLPSTPDGQVPQQFAPAIQPQAYPQPVGPQNPYAQPQYPAGFNAPVSSGNSFQGTQGSVPALKNIRGSSYDALIDQFNRSQ